MATFSKLHLVRNSELDPVWKNMSYLNLEHNCTIFLCSLDVRNIVQGGDPLYAAVNYKQGCGGCIWPKWVRFFAKNSCLLCFGVKFLFFGLQNFIFFGPGGLFSDLFVISRFTESFQNLLSQTRPTGAISFKPMIRSMRKPYKITE